MELQCLKLKNLVRFYLSFIIVYLNFNPKSHFTDQLHCQKGIFVTCDSAMRELIKYLDANRVLGCSFIIAELDENHLFLDARKVPDLERVLEQRREELCPDLNEKDS